MPPETPRRAPHALARNRPLPSAEDAAERVAVMCEALQSDVATIRRALVRQWGFDGDDAFAIAHRERLQSTLNAVAAGRPLKGPMSRLLSVTSAFVASPWFLAAVRHGWSDAELFGVDCNRPAPALAECSLVVGLALACPHGYRLGALDENGATLESEAGEQIAYRRFTRSPPAEWFLSAIPAAAPQARAA